MFEDRVDAGRRLAGELRSFRGADVVVLGLPRGGVPVAAEVAAALQAPLDVIVVRKLGVPFQLELAMGAIGEDGVRVLDNEVLSQARITSIELSGVERRERAVLESQVARLRCGRDRIDLTGRIAIIVDDGIATGSTARVACQLARRLGAARVIVAVPVAPSDRAHHLPEADAVVCVSQPKPFVAVGAHYRTFSATTEGEVIKLLETADRRMGARTSEGPDPEASVDADM